jgi:hypothetical protein
MIVQRVFIFLLAASSFACLLGSMYGLWNMRAFACLVFPPALALLVWFARRKKVEWIVNGAVAGILAAVAYDLFRLPFVLGGIPLFKVFPQFGEMLLGSPDPRWLVQLLGWAYHFSNGAALGIMFLALVPRPTSRKLFWGAVAFALGVEACLLATPYPRFFGLALDSRFIALTLSAHLVFGLALGAICAARRTGFASTVDCEASP